LELNEVLLILGVFLPVFFVAIWQLNRLNPGKNQQKKATSAAETSVSDLFQVQTDQIKEIMGIKNKEIKSLRAQLRPEPEETEPESGEKAVTFEQITELVNTSFPKYSKMLPFFKKDVMKAVKGMTMTEIVQYIGTLTGQTGKSPIDPGAPGSISQDYRTDWA